MGRGRGDRPPDWKPTNPPPHLKKETMTDEQQTRGGIRWRRHPRRIKPAPERVMYYYPDGSPVVGDELLPAAMKWALLFEQQDDQRIVSSTETLYGEKLSTVWLGLDHQWGKGPPLIFETMLFAPKSEAQRDREHNRLHSYAAALRRSIETGDELQLDEDEQTKQYDAWVDKNYPHDQLQLRYSTRNQAQDSHDKLKLQCLIPPRWRHLLLWTVGRDTDWKFYDDED